MGQLWPAGRRLTNTDLNERGERRLQHPNCPSVHSGEKSLPIQSSSLICQVLKPVTEQCNIAFKTSTLTEFCFAVAVQYVIDYMLRLLYNQALH